MMMKPGGHCSGAPIIQSMNLLNKMKISLAPDYMPT